MFTEWLGFTFNRSLPVLSGLLKNDDLGVRTAAGEAIALLYELTDTSGASEEDAEDSAEDEVPPVSSVSIPFYVVVWRSHVHLNVLHSQILVGLQT